MKVEIVRLANGLVSFEVSDLALDQETDIQIVDHLTPDQARDIAQRLLAATGDDHHAAPPNGRGRISEATCRHCDRPIRLDGSTWTHKEEPC